MHRVTPSDGSDPSIQVLREASVTNTLAKVSRCRYTTLWLLMILLHALSAAFLFGCCKLYLLMENEYLDYFANLLAPKNDRHFLVISYVLGGLGAAHGLQLLSHLGASAFARKLTVQPLKLDMIIVKFATLLVNSLYAVLKRSAKTRSGKAQHLRRQLQNEDDEAYSRMFAIRKAVEIATQIPNAYLYSTLVARPWINHTKVALVVANCWSAFIIHKMFLKRSRDASNGAPPPDSRLAIRFFAVVVDALLATSTAILLPSAIFMPYAMQFDIKNLTFPAALLYGDATFPNLVLDNRAFFFMSWDNAGIKLVPHVSVFLCLEAIAAMLHDACQPDRITDKTKSPVVELNPKLCAVAAGSHRALAHSPWSEHKSSRLLYRAIHVLTPLLFLATGGVILGLHLIGQYGTVKGDIGIMEDMCFQRMHPWLASNFSCAVVKFNCYREGVASPSSESLSALEREAVRRIMFMHCPAFVMPSIIREFSFLMGVDLWNTTLVRWGEEAAVSAQLHPSLLFVNFAYVNLTGIPPGLLQVPLPQRLTDLEFTHTNLTGLPQEIIEPWKDVEIIFIEHSLVNPFPSVLMQLPTLSELSLIDNKFDSIPSDALLTASSTHFYNLALSRNALRVLPPAENFDVTYLALEFTQLKELPTWVYTKIWDSVSLGGSPLCHVGSTVQLPEFAHCAENGDPLGEERYPVDLVKPFRSLDA